MRLFIAIELSNEMRCQLGGIAKTLRERSCGGRFVPLENMHVTMHFIGESNDLAGAAEAMRESCRGIRPFTLKLGGYTYFAGSGSSGKTSVVEVTGDLDELGILKETLESALADRGFSQDRKHFRPHITLGRNVEHDELVTEELRDTKLDAETTVTGLTLFESQRIKGGMVYLPLHREKF